MLLDESVLLVSLPVPKVHAMTGVSLGHKNQWGCVPDPLRLRYHAIFNSAICSLNMKLQPAVLADGIFFLDRNGPIDGVPVRMNLIIGASDVGSFDLYACALMGIDWRRIKHLRAAVSCGLMPSSLPELSFNIDPKLECRQEFRAGRTFRSTIALAAFERRWLTWLLYESFFGREVVHRLFYLMLRITRRRPQAA
jgi:uncharacterized protein (DUF362 family)